ncbi:uncharacterized protein LOC127097673 [Lathyrus oleraceus]|uniref:uncharacterized protein LOC127097673 n=1 Tax=Pisum sativum TaxID=3888 RepID=UPI0021D0887F|nr:uncharacterized protein LOC127097673 [Pisum sativum]
MEIEQDPSLSSAYIRSLVKQLATTKKPKETMNTKHHHEHQNLRKQVKVHKKQGRRRLHTTRPYQEKLLNMAEARREIVTALKFHRASKKQAREEEKHQKYQQQQQQDLRLSHSNQQQLSCFDFEQDLRLSRRNPRIYPSCISNLSNDFSYSSSFSHPSLSLPSWPISSSFSPNLLVENSNITLPNQTLGLNLTLHDFNSLDSTLLLDDNNNNNDLSFCSYSPAPSLSPPLYLTNDLEIPSINEISQGEDVSSMLETIESSPTNQVKEGGSHAAMDDEGMEEMRSLGEQYQMEWNDTMNLVTSTLWFNFLKKMENDAPQEDACHHVFDEFMEFDPTWLNAEEERCLEQWSESENYLPDLGLPW